MATCLYRMQSAALLFILSAVGITFCDVKESAQQPAPASLKTSGGDGCGEGLPPPDHPFKVVWNHPDNCERKRIPLHLDRYGFTFNKARQFLGEEIQTMYMKNMGRWPTLSRDGTVRNGGLPQLFNDTTLSETWRGLRRHRVTNFSGLGVLDFEAWRAVFITNYGSLKRYRTQSLELVKRRHPDYNSSRVWRVATQEWEEAARRIMSAKLAVGQALMPGGHWGYYNYPRTWNGDSSRHNNKMAWLWHQATGLYPSIYVRSANERLSDIVSKVAKRVKEAVRIQSTFSPPNTAIFPYANTQSRGWIVPRETLEITLGLPAEMGASGVVIWGSSSYYKDPQQCSRLQEHLRTVVGPMALNLTQFAANCSTTLCGGQGRCVHNARDSLLKETESRRLSGLCAVRDSRFRDYHCRCYTSWTGACCQTRQSSRCQEQQTASRTNDPQHSLVSTESSPTMPHSTT